MIQQQRRRRLQGTERGGFMESEKRKKKVSKAAQKAVAKYKAAHYDRLEIRVAKGEKELIQAKASEKGKSLNAFVNDAIHTAMKE